MKLAIVGCRDYRNKEEFIFLMNTFFKNQDITKIVSGGASGTDLMAKNYAQERGIAYKEFPANWNQYGKAAGPIRNKEIVDYSDKVVAFWDMQSRGTKSTIEIAKQQDKMLCIFVI